MKIFLLAVLVAPPAWAQPAPPAMPGGPMGAPPAPAADSSSPAPQPSGSGLSAAQMQAPPKPKKEKKKEAVDGSTSTAKGEGVDDIYGGAKFRDPFMKLAGAGVAAAPVATGAKEFDAEEFSIHQLSLKGIMRDKAGVTALLVDTNAHWAFVLRGGRLYDMKKKALPGVTGVIKPAEKSVTLTTADKDVQTFRLGEDADEAEE